MTQDPTALRIEFLSARAGRLGYELVQQRSSADLWQLLDAEDGDTVLATLPLADVEKWLNQ
ncbi:hypothetical protein D7D52_17005 [Nocardia yunnanensis]|uniref:DUF4351 domain-containing protein n=1 Tax=Nocardia yunnanensis TaxID=2382165 RepID=A0A386ZCS7_9NOCA|nr:hypothetical protein [Nocardia yunnanensis]AYF75288.1 hypothetical protein D7D52_17005 [Nocardia yunnanensis]